MFDSNHYGDDLSLIRDIQDPLSALDAHVGKAVFQNVLQNSSTGKTRVLVTHALHFLPQSDYILTVVDGRIAERGTYADLMSSEGAFSKFVSEFGSKRESAVVNTQNAEQEDSKRASVRKQGVAGPGIMQTEERTTGAVSGAVYRAYLHAANGPVVVPLLVVSVVLIQVAIILSSYWCALHPLYCLTSLPLSSY
jgi:ABC-type sulfate/molybdate transport systems ATPase subunit